MTDSLNKILNDAIPRWAELTNTKLGSSSYSFRLGSESRFGEYDLKQYIDDLNAAREMDLSGTTAIMLLRGLFDAYVREQSFKAHALIFDHDNVEKTLVPMRAFHALIDQAPCREAAEAFRDSVRLAAMHYGYDVPKLKNSLDDLSLGQLRLAAARSMVNLELHQFTQGDPDPEPLKYNRQIFEFWNINSFIAALHRQWTSGITLALIRDPENVYNSFFVVGLRNGGTITVLTDFVEGEHPEYHNMTRRPDRRLDERAREHHFPYGLLEADAVKHKQVRDKTAIVKMNAKAVPIADLSDLTADEFLWLTLLFDQVAEKFGRGDFKTEELSYTGEMVVTPHALVDGAHALVKVGHYQPLVLPPLTIDTTTAERADNDTPNGHNAWMEERYKHRVPEVILDVVGDRKALEVGKQVKKLLPGKVDIGEISLPNLRRQPGVISWGGELRLNEIAPHALDPRSFGTKAQIDRNRAWSARRNMMQVIERLAVAEFASKQELILSWYRKRLERNLSFLLKAVALGKLDAPTASWKSGRHQDPDFDPFPAKDKMLWSTGNILYRALGRQWSDTKIYQKGVDLWKWSHGLTGNARDWTNENRRRAYVMCMLDPPKRATVFVMIQPDNPKALALLMGIPERKIPWPLQHWTTREPYTGNSIIRRIDPQDALLDNPWRHLELNVTLAFSKRAFNRLCKEHDVASNIKDDDDEDED